MFRFTLTVLWILTLPLALVARFLDGRTAQTERSCSHDFAGRPMPALAWRLSVVPTDDEPCPQCSHPCNIFFPAYSDCRPRCFCKACGWREVRTSDKAETTSA